jgi:hypothetical protein
MPAKRAKPPKKPKKAVKKSAKVAAKTTRKSAASFAKKPKPAAKKPTARKATAPKFKPIDLSAFPAEAITQKENHICLACVLDVFTRHMGVAPRTAHLEIKRYMPSIAELNAAQATRPYFAPESPSEPCPYCGSSSKRHARLVVYRIESGKATDALRRDLVKKLPRPATHSSFSKKELRASTRFISGSTRPAPKLSTRNRKKAIAAGCAKSPATTSAARSQKKTGALCSARRMRSAGRAGWRADGKLMPAGCFSRRICSMNCCWSNIWLAGRIARAD